MSRNTIWYFGHLRKQNYVRVRFILGVAAAPLWAGFPAFGASGAQPDIVLQGAMPGPCIAALEGPDYVPGLDADGQPVARADIGAGRVPVPGAVWVPLPGSQHGRGGHGRGGGAPQPPQPAYMALGRERIDRLVNPEPEPCFPHAR